MNATIRRRCVPSRDADRDLGSVTLGVAAVFPACLALVLLVVQAALIAHARDIAEAGAQEGLRQARLYNGTAELGRRAAHDFLGQTGDGLLTAVTVDATRDSDRARVEVRGRALTLMPGIHLRVRGVAAGPVERFVPDLAAQ
jgi:hypothetical protein